MLVVRSSRPSIRRVAWVLAALSTSVLAACSDDSSSDDAAASTTVVETTVAEAPVTEAPTTAAPTTTVAPEPLRILVTNDDGIGADGIAAIVEGLSTIDNVEITVVAPATNQSGTGGKVTDGPLTVTDAKTAKGFAGKAVEGFPADSIVWAIDQGGIDFVPDLVVSGINFGQNYSLEIIPVSGTVGAARAAVLRNIPAIAISQGTVGERADFASGVEAGLAWIRANFDALLAREPGDPVTELVNINIPTCAEGTSIRGTVEVPTGSLNNTDYAKQDCASTVQPTTDVEGFQNGYVVVSRMDVNAAPFTS